MLSLSNSFPCPFPLVYSPMVLRLKPTEITMITATAARVIGIRVVTRVSPVVVPVIRDVQNIEPM